MPKADATSRNEEMDPEDWMFLKIGTSPHLHPQLEDHKILTFVNLDPQFVKTLVVPVLKKWNAIKYTIDPYGGFRFVIGVPLVIIHL